MGRVLVIVLIVVLAVWLLRRALRRGAPPSAGAQKSAVGELVSCARCGLNLPRNEARESGGALFCSDEHARLGPAS